MADIINLNSFRKARERDAKDKQAAANRSRFGRTKGEKARDDSEAERKQRLLDMRKLGEEDEGGPQAS